MSERYSAFSFVDRITETRSGKGATGQFLIPAHIAEFPSTFAAEAVGQLAAWNAMAHLGYRLRPVAGIAADVRFLRPLRPGQQLELHCVIDTCDEEAVSYGGWADADGVRVMELDHSVGPMLPMEQFDDPAAVRERFELLISAGAPSGRYHGVPEPEMDIVEDVVDERVRATLRVPASAPFFGDHFPRRPVYPGTLLLHAQIQLALRATARSTRWAGGQPMATRTPDTKIRSFIAPGDELELTVDFQPTNESGVARARTSVRCQGKLVAGGKLELVASAEQFVMDERRSA